MGSIQQVMMIMGGASPLGVTDLQFWLPGSSIVGLNADDQISTWPDISGHGRDCTGTVQTTKKPIYRPTDGPNSTPAVRMCTSAGVGGYFTVPNFLNGVFSAGNGFSIVKLDNDPPDNSGKCGPPMGDWGTAGDDYFPAPIPDGQAGKILSSWGSTVRKNTGDPATSLTGWVLYEERTASGAWSNYVNSTQQFTTATNTVNFNTNPYLGFSFTNTKQLQGLVAEYIFFGHVLTTNERAIIYAYLNLKYGFTLS